MTLLLSLFSLSASASDCAEDQFSSVLDSASAVELAFANLDDAGFDAAALELADGLPCVRTQLAPGDAAQIHRAMGLAAFVAGDSDGSAKSFAALKALQPAWKPPASLMPDGHPVREIWDGASATDAREPISGAPAGGWVVDGARASDAPAGHAFIAQGFDGAGGVVYTGYLRRAGDVPDLAPEDVQPLPTEPAPEKGNEESRSPVGAVLIGTGVALLAGSGVSFGLASSDRKKAGDSSTSYDDIQKHAKSANVKTGLGVGLGVAGAAALGVGIAGKW